MSFIKTHLIEYTIYEYISTNKKEEEETDKKVLC